jgi:hypothetical protein
MTTRIGKMGLVSAALALAAVAIGCGADEASGSNEAQDQPVGTNESADMTANRCPTINNWVRWIPIGGINSFCVKCPKGSHLAPAPRAGGWHCCWDGHNTCAINNRVPAEKVCTLWNDCHQKYPHLFP